ncbi:MAG TPA: hypothetical protein VMP01_19885 [Pirellulaceae bacterium]|nr:hypothetical protein [Pirellulaceae bacterium]
MTSNEREMLEDRLRVNLQAQSDELRQLLESASDHWGYEDPIYRFYHQSFKVYPLTESTTRIVTALQRLLPDQPLNPWFLQIVGEGTGKEFQIDDNQRWLEATRPILEAFFHARYFLEMACRYAKAPEKDRPMPSGWAALLYLFNLR